MDCPPLLSPATVPLRAECSPLSEKLAVSWKCPCICDVIALSAPRPDNLLPFRISGCGSSLTVPCGLVHTQQALCWLLQMGRPGRGGGMCEGGRECARAQCLQFSLALLGKGRTESQANEHFFIFLLHILCAVKQLLAIGEVCDRVCCFFC